MGFIKRALGMQPAQAFNRYLHAPATESPDQLSIRYLGTAGFVLTAQQHTLVLDPYLSRHPVTTLLTRPLPSRRELVTRHLPKANDVLVGHAHYDHILDAPELCRQTGARLIGSRATINVGRAAGLPEHQLLETAGRETLRSGDWQVRGLPSLHGKVLAGRIPFPGDITEPPPWPPRMHQLKHGLVLNWWIDTGSLRVVHIDSADFINEELQGMTADVLCLCAIGRRFRPNYVQDAVRLLKPRWVIPCHWDTMITPFDQEPDLIPGVDLPGFFTEIEAAGATPVYLPMRGETCFGACD